MANKRRSKFERLKLALLVTRLWKLLLPVCDVVKPWLLDRLDYLQLAMEAIFDLLNDWFD